MRIKFIIKQWYLAHFTKSACWKVKYPDGRTTRLLPWNEAKNLSEIFGGKIYVEYNQTYGGSI